MAWEVWWALVLGFAISAIVQAWVPRERIQQRARRLRPAPGGARHRPRRRVVVVQLRGDRDRQEPVSEGRQRRVGARLPVRLDEPRVRARDRDLGPDRLAVHARRVRRRPRADRADDGAAAPVRVKAPGGAGARARPSRPTAATSTTERRRSACSDPSAPAPRARARGPTSRTTSATTGRCCGRRSRSASCSPGSSANSPTASSTRCSSPTLPAGVKLVENAIVGPIIAVLSFVCSVGNVPLAAVLWSGGISFAGVIAFIFADLIVLPIIQIYRKYYGNAYALRIVALMFVDDGDRGADRRRPVRRRRADPARPPDAERTSSARSRSTTRCSPTCSLGCCSRSCSP